MILTKKQLAEKLQVSEKTIENYEKSGMPSLRALKGVARFDWEDVKKWMTEKREVIK